MPVREMACHYVRPFIDRYGDIYPCCFKNRDRRYVIGNVGEDDIVAKMESYDLTCCCDMYAFRKRSDEGMAQLHVQTSLACNGKCAVCYVNAPLRKQAVEVDFDKVFAFIERLHPVVIQFEGGEIPVQKRSLRFIERVHAAFPDIHLKLLTNGCYPQDMAEILPSLFKSIDVSFMGATPRTYYVETCLDLETTKHFARLVHARGVDLGLRFICTPLTLPEAGEFLHFAMDFAKANIWISECNLGAFIRTPPDIPYWKQIIPRCQVLFREALLKRRPDFTAKACNLWFTPMAAGLLNITPKLLDMFKLTNVHIR